MDQNFASVIIAVITGLFTVITLVIQKKQDKVINKIDEHTMFIEKEKGLKQKLNQQRREQEEVIQRIMLILLDTHVHILKNTQIAGAMVDPTIFTKSEDIKAKFQVIAEQIEDTTKEYEIILSMSNEFQQGQG